MAAAAVPFCIGTDRERVICDVFFVLVLHKARFINEQIRRIPDELYFSVWYDDCGRECRMHSR